MAQGSKSLKAPIKPDHVKETSSPAKVFQSRASKPSGVALLASAAAAGTDAALIDAMAAKLDELIASLKK